MGNGSSNISHIYPTLPRTVFFPGNLVTGNLVIECKDEVEYSCISINLMGELRQTYLVNDHHHNGRGGGGGLAALAGSTAHMARREVATSIQSVGCTIVGSPSGKGSYRLGKGQHNYEWAFMLPPTLLPSANLTKKQNGFGDSPEETVSIYYYITAQVMIDGKSAKQGSVPIHVLLPIAESMWARPSSISKNFSLDLTACACCERGHISGSAGMSKTIVALDRDSLAYGVQIDATNSQDPVENMTVSLIAYCRVKGGNRPLNFQAVIFSQKVRCGVQAGQKGSANGVLQLGANRPPTIQSSLIDITYKCRFEFEFDFSASTQSEVDVFVAHSVDATNQSAMLQQMHQQIQSGHHEVPNLLNPLYQQYRPPALQNMQMQPQYQQPPPPQMQQQQQYHQHQQQYQPQYYQQGQQQPPQQQMQQQQGGWGQGSAAPPPNYGGQQRYAQQPPPPQQQPEQYNAANFDQSQQQQFSHQQQQFGGIAAFPNQQLTMQAQQA